MKKGLKKAVVMLLSMAMIFTFMAMPVYADEAEGGITVYLTVSDHGTIAAANDGSAMAWREVTVTDVNEDGHYTFDEALVAAHKAYNSEDGLDVLSSGWVNKFWGQTNDAGFSFIQNNETTDLVTEAEIAEGDHLVASSNKDELLYLDWASFFDKYDTEVTAGETFTLNMKGFPAMTKDAPSAAEGMQVGIFKDGAFQVIEGAVTDESGNVSLSFDEPGTYIVSASGSAKDTVDLTVTYALMEVASDKDGKTVYGKMDWQTYETWFGYTAKDYGTGAYPYDEIQWMLYMDEDYEIVNDPATFEDGNLLYSGNAICNCPIIAPCCIVTVKEAPEKFLYDGEEVNFIKADGSQFGMFTPQEGTTCVLDGDNVVIHYVPKNKTTYEGFNWGSIYDAKYADKDQKPEIDVKANADGTYDITLSKDHCGYAYPVAVVKKSWNAEKPSWTSAEQYYLAIPNIGEEADKIPYEGDEVNFIKADGSQFGMFTPQEGTTCVLDGDNVVIHYIPKNKTTYIGFKWGSIVNTAFENEDVQPDVDVKPNSDGTYDITLSKDYCGYAHPVAVVKKTWNAEKPSWTSAEQYYLAIPVIEEPLTPGWNKNEDGKWIYVNDDGSVATGWNKVSGKWYYMDTEGVMQTGWVKVSGKWYYMNKSGVMQTGWQKISNKWYYLKDNGAMASKEWVKGYYWINKDGTWTYEYKASWKKTASGKWWFGDTSGWYAKNTTIVIGGKSYTFDAKGYMK